MSTSISPEAPAVVNEEQSAKKTRNTKPLFELPEDTKVEVTPEGFDYNTHRMTKAQFKDVPCYMEHRAFVFEAKAAQLRADAAEYRINPPKRQGGAKKAKLLSRLAKLEAKLAELGVNLDDLVDDED